MHTAKIILGGFLLLGVCLLLGRWIAGNTAGVISAAARCFLALWAVVTLLNLWFGVSRAGYTVRDEAPVALVVFAIPAIAAVAIWWRGSYQ